MNLQALVPTPQLASKKNHTLAIVLSSIGGALLLIIIAPIIYFTVTASHEKGELKRELSSFRDYSLFASWRSDTPDNALYNINILCLDQCSNVSLSFTSKASGQGMSNTEATKKFLSDKGYTSITTDRGCNELLGCTVYGRKGNLHTEVSLPKQEGGYTNVYITY